MCERFDSGKDAAMRIAGTKEEQAIVFAGKPADVR
jgi:hypothetical protein